MTSHGRIGAALVLCVLAAASAQAAITPTLVAVTPQVDGTFTYVYEVALAADQAARPEGATPTGGITPTGAGAPSAAFQDYFTIYDFAGLVGGSATQPAGWTFGFNTVGPTPSTASPADDPALYNVFWVRTGAPVIGPADLGRFTVNSVIGLVALKPYTSDATQTQGPQAGSAVASSGTVFAPQLLVGCTTCAGVSEPPIGRLPWLATAAFGLLVLGSRRAWRRPV